MKIPNIDPVYRKVNTIISIIIILTLFMPYLFYVKNVDQKKYFFQLNSIPSHYFQITGGICPSTGLTRSIKSLYNGFYDLSLHFNQSGIILFLMLIMQLLLRLVVFNLKSHLVPWVDMLQIMFTIFLARIILEQNFSGLFHP